MTFGAKLKEARKITGLSQEQFAEKMSISRSAVAKWENDIGIPDVGNLKNIARLLNVSIDSLLDVEDGANNIDCIYDDMNNITDENDIQKEHIVETCPEYAQYYYMIELNGWNDGVLDVIILGQDDEFVYYKNTDKENTRYGMIGRKYITSISKRKKIENITENEIIDRNYFCNKHVKLETANKEGFIKGFFDMKNDEYMDVVIQKFDDGKVIIALKNEIDIKAITKIEEI